MNCFEFYFQRIDDQLYERTYGCREHTDGKFIAYEADRSTQPPGIVRVVAVCETLNDACTVAIAMEMKRYLEALTDCDKANPPQPGCCCETEFIVLFEKLAAMEQKLLPWYAKIINWVKKF